MGRCRWVERNSYSMSTDLSRMRRGGVWVGQLRAGCEMDTFASRQTGQRDEGEWAEDKTCRTGSGNCLCLGGV